MSLPTATELLTLYRKCVRYNAAYAKNPVGPKAYHPAMEFQDALQELLELEVLLDIEQRSFVEALSPAGMLVLAELGLKHPKVAANALCMLCNSVLKGAEPAHISAALL